VPFYATRPKRCGKESAGSERLVWLDGRDPNSYVELPGPWAAFTIEPGRRGRSFGKVRYMRYNGAKSNFDVQACINTWNSAIELNTYRE